MNINDWVSWCLSVIVTAVNWIKDCTIMGIPILYLLIGIIIMGVVIRVIPFRA